MQKLGISKQTKLPLRQRIKTFLANKKGVSQMVEMLIIVGVTLAVAAVVVGIIWTKVNEAKDGKYNETPTTNPTTNG